MTISGYELHFVPRIDFGPGTRFLWLNPAPEGPVLAVCGRHAEPAVRSEFGGVCAEIVSGIHPEPEFDDVEKIRAAIRRTNAKTIVGIGGGSVLDAAKAGAALAAEPAPVGEYFYGRRAAGPRKIRLILLPTTAGTGAEVTGNAVLLDPATHIKQSLRTPGMTADRAIVDPELTYASPPGITAAAGFDALTQAIEAYLSKKSNAVSAALALGAAERLFTALPGAVRDSRADRDRAAEGSLMGALAFAQSGLGAVHGIAHPAGSIWHVPHGTACAILLPAVLRRNLTAAPGTAAALARALGLSDAAALVDALEALRRDTGLPESFSSFGAAREDFAFIVKNCRSGSMKCNPRDFSDAEVAEILEEVCR